MARPGRRIVDGDDEATQEVQNPIAVEAAACGVGRALEDRPAAPRLLTLSERVMWSVGLGLVCGAAVSIKWTALATPGMIAVETFFALYYLREPAPLPDLMLMGFSALSLYSSLFYIHFAMLTKHGDGDGFMRLEFQRTLVGNDHYDPNAPKPWFPVVFTQLNLEMLSANARIDQPHHWMSKWHSWPTNSRGVLYYSSDAGEGLSKQVYLLGPLERNGCVLTSV